MKDQVSGRVSIPCWHVKPDPNAQLKPRVYSVKSKFSIKVITLVQSLIGWEVIVTGRASYCHLIFLTGKYFILYNKISVSFIELPE